MVLSSTSVLNAEGGLSTTLVCGAAKMRRADVPPYALKRDLGAGR